MVERVIKGWVEAERAQAVAGLASSSLGWATPIPSTRVLAETVQAHPTLGLRAVAVSSSEVLTEPGKMAEMQGLVRGVVREAIEQGQKAGRGRAGPAERAERETAFAPAGAAATGSAAAATAAAAAAAGPPLLPPLPLPLPLLLALQARRRCIPASHTSTEEEFAAGVPFTG